MSEPVSFLIIAIAVALAAVPLILKVVPPNNLYGLRTKRTLANRELWFQGNHFAGWAFFLAATLSACVFLGFPQLSSGRSIEGLLVLLVPLLAALGLSLAYLRRL